MKRWTTADLHFGHKNIFGHEPSRLKIGSNTDEMDKELIKRWNKLVGVEDHVYINGDFSFDDSERTRNILSVLNGKKHLIVGNHDFHNTYSKLFSLGFTSVQAELKLTLAKDVTVKLSHFPYLSNNSDGFEKGAYFKFRPVKEDNVWLIHGHSHSKGKKMDVENKSICVSVELWNFYPVNLDVLVGMIRKEDQKNKGSK